MRGAFLMVKIMLFLWLLRGTFVISHRGLYDQYHRLLYHQDMAKLISTSLKRSEYFLVRLYRNLMVHKFKIYVLNTSNCDILDTIRSIL